MIQTAFWHCVLSVISDVQEQQLKLADKLKERREAQQRKLAAQQEKEREQFVKKADKAANPGDVSEVMTHSHSPTSIPTPTPISTQEQMQNRKRQFSLMFVDCIFAWCEYTKISFQQESPPVWTQEAYRLPRTKYTPCCFSWGYPPVLTLDLDGGRNTSSYWQGRYPNPCPDLRWGTPRPDLGWGTPCPDLGRGYSPIPHRPEGVPHYKCERTDACENITFPTPLECGR